MIAFILMAQWLNKVFHVLFVNPEGAIDVSPQDNPNSEPEPDFAVLKKAATEYKTGNPPPPGCPAPDRNLRFDSRI